MVEPATDGGVAAGPLRPPHSLVGGLGGKGDAKHYYAAVVRLIDRGPSTP